MDREARLARLRERSLPFAISAAGSAWEHRTVDVRAVHDEAVSIVRGMIARAARLPRRSLAGLIIGQAGAGKTHLLGTLCHDLTPDVGGCSFAEVRPLIDPASPLSHLLREIAGNLLQRPPGYALASQLAALPARAIAGFVRAAGGRRAPLVEIARELEARPGRLLELVRAERYAWLMGHVCGWLAHVRPETWEPCLQAVFQYPLPAHRAASSRWLCGEDLDDEDLERSGLVAGDASGREEHAARTLVTFGTLLAHDRPLLICFDQLENLDTRERREAFGRQLEFLTTRMFGVVVLAAVRGDRWSGLCEQLAPRTVALFEQCRIDLGGCSRDQALELVRGRLATVADGEPVPDLFPFDAAHARGQVEAIASDGLVPRLVLARANRLWLDLVYPDAPLRTEPVAEDPRDVLDRWLQERRAAIAQRPEREGADAATLAEALRLVVGAVGPRWSDRPVAVDRAIGPFQRAAFVLRAPASPPAAAATVIPVFVDSHGHHLAVGATLRAATALLESKEAAGSIYIRDGRRAIPRRPQWPATNDRKEHLAAAGGLVLELEAEAVIDWVALVHVMQSIRSQDVTYMAAPERSAPVTGDHMNAWIRDRKPLRGIAPVLAYVAQRMSCAGG
jgi:hypothetical protein